MVKAARRVWEGGKAARPYLSSARLGDAAIAAGSGMFGRATAPHSLTINNLIERFVLHKQATHSQLM
jgi:hypothetical protein